MPPPKAQLFQTCEPTMHSHRVGLWAKTVCMYKDLPRSRKIHTIGFWDTFRIH